MHLKLQLIVYYKLLEGCTDLVALGRGFPSAFGHLAFVLWIKRKLITYWHLQNRIVKRMTKNNVGASKNEM